MPIDNNETEQLMKQVAIGRKNWLLIGEVEPGYRAADLLTLASNAVRNDLDVFAYVKDVLDRLLAGETDYHTLRPDVWKESHPEAVRVDRAEETRPGPMPGQPAGPGGGRAARSLRLRQGVTPAAEGWLWCAHTLMQWQDG